MYISIALPDLEVNPLVASILQLTPQELLGLLPDGGSHSHCTETECSAFASMRTRLGPVDNIVNHSIMVGWVENIKTYNLY